MSNITYYLCCRESDPIILTTLNLNIRDLREYNLGILEHLIHEDIKGSKGVINFTNIIVWWRQNPTKLYINVLGK